MSQHGGGGCRPVCPYQADEPLGSGTGSPRAGSFHRRSPSYGLGQEWWGSRPIAIGETIRRLVSKCCCDATIEGAKLIFGPLQVGVATQGGAEASIHAVRRLAKEFGDDPGKIMLKVDFSNAFNVVDGTEMLARFTSNFRAVQVGRVLLLPAGPF